MSRIDDGFRSLSRVRAPELWSTIQTHEPRRPQPAAPSPLRRIAIVAFALLISVAAFLLMARAMREPNTQMPATTGSPTIALPADAIVFAHSSTDELDAETELGSITPDSTARIPVVVPGIDATFVGEPAWSQDGSRLAIIVGPAEHVHAFAGDGNLYVMDADGTDVRRLTSGLVASSPTWSPDGTQLAFVREQGQELVVLNDDGSAQHVVSMERGYYQSPSWSPDGSWIAFQSSLSTDIESTAVFVIHPDGTGIRQLTSGSSSEGFPAWSPSAERIAYSAGDRLWIMDADGSDQHRVTSCSSPCVSDFDPTWSPDGSQLAFVRQEDGGAARRLYTVDLATGEVRLLTSTESDVSSPSWRPQR